MAPITPKRKDRQSHSPPLSRKRPSSGLLFPNLPRPVAAKSSDSASVPESAPFRRPSRHKSTLSSAEGDSKIVTNEVLACPADDALPPPAFSADGEVSSIQGPARTTHCGPCFEHTQPCHLSIIPPSERKGKEGRWFRTACHECRLAKLKCDCLSSYAAFAYGQWKAAGCPDDDHSGGKHRRLRRLGNTLGSLFKERSLPAAWQGPLLGPAQFTRAGAPILASFSENSGVVGASVDSSSEQKKEVQSFQQFQRESLKRDKRLTRLVNDLLLRVEALEAERESGLLSSPNIPLDRGIPTVGDQSGDESSELSEMGSSSLDRFVAPSDEELSDGSSRPSANTDDVIAEGRAEGVTNV